MYSYFTVFKTTSRYPITQTPRPGTNISQELFLQKINVNGLTMCGVITAIYRSDLLSTILLNTR